MNEIQSNKDFIYKKYQTLLKESRNYRGRCWNLVNGWTKEARCTLVAEEIIYRQSEYRFFFPEDSNLLTTVLTDEVFPHLGNKNKGAIEKKWAAIQVQFQKNHAALCQKHEKTCRILQPDMLKTISEQFQPDRRNEELEKIHEFFDKQISVQERDELDCLILRNIFKTLNPYETLALIDLLKRKKNILELAKKNPLKINILIEIMKSDRDLFNIILNNKQSTETQEKELELIDQLYNLKEKTNIKKYLIDFQSVHKKVKLEFIINLNYLFLQEGADANKNKSEEIEILKKIPKTKRPSFCKGAAALMNGLKGAGFPCTTGKTLEWLSSLPTEEMRKGFIEKAPQLVLQLPLEVAREGNPNTLWYFFLFPDRRDFHEAQEFTNAILGDENLPPPFGDNSSIHHRLPFMIQLQTVYNSPGFPNIFPVEVYNFFNQIDRNERQTWADQIAHLQTQLNFSSPLHSEYRRKILLFILNRVPFQERSDFAAHLSHLRFDLMQGEGSMDQCLQSLAAEPKESRAVKVQTLNLELEENEAWTRLHHINPEQLTIDPSDLSEERRNPAICLKQIHQSVKQNQKFPRFRYKNSAGIDVGGVTRDVVTKLFELLSSKNQKKLPLREADNDLYLPKIQQSSGAVSIGDQIECYEAIGMIFARILNGDKGLPNSDSITIGSRFSPILFEMIHSLSLDELNEIHRAAENGGIKKRIVSFFFSILYPPEKDRVKEIKEKLASIYLKSAFPQLFKTDGIDEDTLNREIGLLRKGIVSERLAGLGVESDFLKSYEVESIAEAVFTIGKSMHRNLLSSNHWSLKIGPSHSILREKIEGVLTADRVISAFGFREAEENSPQGMLQKWIRDTDSKTLQNFIYTLTGSLSLPPNAKLNMWASANPNQPGLPQFHTCLNRIDVYCYPNYPTFKQNLELSIESCMAAAERGANDPFQMG